MDLFPLGYLLEKMTFIYSEKEKCVLEEWQQLHGISL